MKRNAPSQKGVHALFTPRKEKRTGLGKVVGVAVALTGVSAWLLALAVFLGSTDPIILPDKTASSIMMLSIAIPMIAAGSTTFAYSHATRQASDDSADPEALAREVDALTGPRTSGQPSFESIARASDSQTRAEVAAIIEAIIILFLYGGLLREYDSSVYMRAWVQSNLPIATLALNDNVFFLAAGVMIASVAFHIIAKRKS